MKDDPHASWGVAVQRKKPKTRDADPEKTF